MLRQGTLTKRAYNFCFVAWTLETPAGPIKGGKRLQHLSLPLLSPELVITWILLFLLSLCLSCHHPPLRHHHQAPRRYITNKIHKTKKLKHDYEISTTMPHVNEDDNIDDHSPPCSVIMMITMMMMMMMGRRRIFCFVVFSSPPSNLISSRVDCKLLQFFVIDQSWPQCWKHSCQTTFYTSIVSFPCFCHFATQRLSRVQCARFWNFPSCT